MRTRHAVLIFLAIFLTNRASFAQDPYTGLKVHYPFDDLSSSSTDDHSGYFNNAVLGSGVTQIANRHGSSNNAFYFDGTTNGYAEVLPSTSINSALVNSNNATSISFWFNPTDWSTATPFIPWRMVCQLVDGSSTTNNGSVEIYWNPITVYNPSYGNFFEVRFWNGSTITHMFFSNNIYAANTWHHVVLNIDWGSYTADLYVDDVLDNATSGYFVKPSNPAIEIGRHIMTSVSEEVEGGIDELRLYDKLLSTGEIDLLYNDLHQVAYYPLAANAHDYSGFGNHAVKIGTALTSTADRFGNGAQAYGFGGAPGSFLATDWNSPDPSLNAAAMAATCISAWVKPSTKAPPYPYNRSICQLIDRHNTNSCNIYDLFYNYSTSRFLLANWNGGIVVYTYSNRTYSAGSWHHLAAIYDRANAKCSLYVDDSLDISVTGVALAPPSHSWLEIGEHHYWSQDNYTGQDWNFKGDIDGLRVYNDLLSRSEIRGLFWGTKLNKPAPTAIANLQPGTVSIFPNPTTDRIEVRADGMKLDKATINVYDMLGKKQITEGPSATDNNTRVLHTECLPPGVYLLEVTGAAGTREVARFTRQ